MNRPKFNYDKFTHCLRIQVFPDKYEEERTQSNLKFCLDNGVKNVMLFINAEEHNIGHMTIEEAKPWVDVLKRETKTFRDNGISVALNLWHSILHLDRGRKLKKGQDFTRMTDLRGNKCQCVACMLDENWKKYFREFVIYVVREIDPDMFWVEDDFRLHNHAPLEYGGCFCDLHMSQYCKKLGKKETREQFVKNMLKPNTVTPERKAWLDINKKTMIDFSQYLRDIVQEAKPGLPIALMSSDPKKHMIEARDWAKVMDNFTVDNITIDRIHLPCYIEMQPKQYYWEFNSISMQCRALLPESTLIYPELENISFSPFAKNARFLRYQLESSIPLMVSGMTYDIFDFLGNGCPEYGYGKVLKDLTPYFQSSMELGVKFKDLKGVIVPISEKSCYYKTIEKGEKIEELMPMDSWFGSYFAMIGVNYQYSTKTSFNNEIVAVSDQYLKTLSKEQITNLFNNNFVILEGNAVLSLFDMGLQSLANIKSAKVYEYETNHQSYEQNCDGNVCLGINGMKASSYINAGNWIDVVYDTDNKQVLSGSFTAKGERVGDGSVIVENKVAVMPYQMTGLLYDQMHELRVQNAKKIVGAFGKQIQTPLVIMPITGISSYLYQNQNTNVLILVNSTLDNLEKVEFYVENLDIKDCFEIDKSGKQKAVDYQVDNNKVTINQNFEYLSTKTYVFKI